MEPKGTFTHFLNIPLISDHARQLLGNYQDLVATHAFKEQQRKVLRKNNPDFFHLTLCMLALTAETRPKAQEIMKQYEQQIKDILKGVQFKFSSLKCFRGKKGKEVGVIYLDIIKDQSYEKFLKVVDILVRQMVKQQVIFTNELKAMHINYDHNKGVYHPIDTHVTMFRTDSNYVKQVDFDEAMKKAVQFEIKESFAAETVDISIRNTKDLNRFCIPLARIVI